jgi:Uma2 family endonuclease
VVEFLAWEREQPERYEYAGGGVTMMTGASLVHVTITMNIAFALRQFLRGSGCRPFTNDAKILAGGSVRYPDITVTCTPYGGKDDIVPDPIVVIEVISPSTEREDRGRKKFDYFATPSIQQYAIIEQDARRVDLYTRSGDRWTDEIVEGDATLTLSSIGVEITLDAIYEDTELDAIQPREDGRQAPAL